VTIFYHVVVFLELKCN